MKWITELYYGTISGGAKNGHVMFDATFSGSEPTSEEVVETYEKIVSHDGRKCKRIHLHGAFPANDRGFIDGLAESLRKLGFEILITTSSPVWRSWFANATWLTVEVEGPGTWAPYRFTELCYLVSSKDQADLLLPGDYVPGGGLLYVKPAEGLSSADLFAFIKSSRYLWNVWTESKKIKEIIV
jgi:hypothetical protein